MLFVALFIGGIFNGTAAANAGGTQLNNLARYDLTTRQWTSMGRVSVLCVIYLDDNTNKQPCRVWMDL